MGTSLNLDCRSAADALMRLKVTACHNALVVRLTALGEISCFWLQVLNFARVTISSLLPSDDNGPSHGWLASDNCISKWSWYTAKGTAQTDHV